jgi:polysaccharide pyruvyl transferase CsaB
MPDRPPGQPARRLVIAGCYGYGSTGDEAALGVMLRRLRTDHPGLAPTVVSGDPRQTIAVHGVEAVSNGDMAAVISAVESSDLVILAGGGHFDDHRGFDVDSVLTSRQRGLAMSSAFVLLAMAARKPFMLYAVGVGPLVAEVSRHHTRVAFTQAAAATVRDPASRDLVVSLGVDPTRVVVTADPAVLCEAVDEERALSQLQAEGLTTTSRPIIAVAPRQWTIGADADEWPRRVSAGLDMLIDRLDAQVIFLPFRTLEGAHTDDRAVASLIHDGMRRQDRAIVLQGDYSAADKAGMIGVADLALGMRLHAILFAARTNVPVVGLGGDATIRSAMRQIGCADFALDIGTLSAATLVRQATTALERRDEISARLKASVARLATAAQENDRLVGELLTGGGARPPLDQEGASFVATALLNLARHAQEREGVIDEQASANARLRGAVDERDRRLDSIYRSRMWRAANLLWSARRKIGRIAQGSQDQAPGASATGSPEPRALNRLGRLIERRLGPDPKMSWHAYAFDAFKRARMAAFGADLSRLSDPGEPGLVSIVLPAYNGADYLPEALDSILAQRYPHFEVIAVDDGSTDATADILEEYARRDSRFRVVHQQNQKLPRALSRGFRLARGEFLTWTSCDNRLHPDFLSRMVDCLRRRPCWDMTYANIDIIGEDGGPLRNTGWYSEYQQPPGSQHIYLPGDVSELNTYPKNFVGAAFLYRARVAHLLGDYSPIRFGLEDYDYWMRVNALLTLRHADFAAPIYEYRYHATSLTARDEELGITRGRARLLVFDDFRRDLYLAPLIWFVDDTRASSGARPLARQFARMIERRGRLLLDGRRTSPSMLPRLWQPAVYVRIVDDPERLDGPPSDLSPSVLRVAVVVGDGSLPEQVKDGWELCLAAGRPPRATRLQQPYQGWLAAPEPETLFAAADIRARSKQAALIEDEILTYPAARCKVTVVICVHERLERLEPCIASLANQSFQSDDYEILVVNDDREHASIVGRLISLGKAYFGGREDRLRLIHCPIVGLSHARNAGIGEARGEVVAFVNHDAVAEPDLLARLWEAFAEHPDVGVVGGHILLKPPPPRPAGLKPSRESYWGQFVTQHAEYAEVTHWRDFPRSGNWSARRRALVEIGGFRTRHGQRGADAWGGEEVVAAALIQRLGYRVAIMPQARVLQDIDQRRISMNHIRRSIRSGLLGAYQAQKDLYLPMETDVPGTLAHIGELAGQIWRPGGRPVADLLISLLAQVDLLREQVRDLARRRQAPIVVAAGCPAPPAEGG